MTVGVGTRGFCVMRVSLSGKNERILARGAAVLLLGGLAAGCSSGAMRFTDATAGLFTGSTSNQRQIINNQPYPGDAAGTAAGQQAAQAVASAGQVSRSSLPPVGAATAAAKAAPAAVEGAATQTVAQATSKAKQTLDETTTGAVAAATSVEDNVKGWSRAGGTQVTVKEGETVYNLSKRFGVPADILMRVNGLSSESALKSGQKLVVPTYVYTAKAGVSAPDNDPKVVEAKSSRGVKPTEEPKPLQAPDGKVAVLPQSPKVKEGAQAPAEAVSAKDSKPAAKGTYTVASGDSLSKIARKTGVSVTALKEANGLKDGNVRIGQVLKLAPGAAVAEAKKPANVDSEAKTASIPSGEAKPDAAKVAAAEPAKKADKAIEQAEQENDEAAPNATGIGKMRWPVRGKVVANYGSSGGAKSDGIDISVPKGTPVKAAENGVVIYAGDGLKEFGNTVLVRHENGLVTVYGHASELKVQRGQKVKRGDEIAVSGMSGNATSPKLHFEVRKNSAPVDPKGFLE